MSLNRFHVLFLLLKISYIYCMNEICSKNIDCTDVNSICLNGKCTCGPFAYFNDKSKACLTYVTQFGEYCQEDQQCKFLGDNSSCRKNVCVCRNQYRWFQGKCQKYVNKGENCKTNTDCYDGMDSLALTCKKGKCDCSEGFYNRGYDCRRISPADTSACGLTIDCQNSTLTCARSKCVVPSELIVEDEDIVWKPEKQVDSDFSSSREVGYTCNYDEDCRNMVNSLCKNSVCQCKEGHYLNETNGNCWAGLTACGDDGDCIDNAFCYLSTSCICKPGFFYKSGNCVPELGMPDAIKCGNISASHLIDGACYCINYWYGSVNNRECGKATAEPALTCLTNEWCNNLGPYSICVDGVCTCNSYAKLNTETTYCEKIDDNIEGECSRDKDCSYNEICSNGHCQCMDGFRNSSGTCLPEIGGSCATISCNHIANAQCIDGLCECALDSIGEENVCMKLADKLYDPCEVDAQCAKLNFTHCAIEDGAINKTCICADNYVDVDIDDTLVCMASKKYGDPCMKSTDCTLVLNRSFQCRNSICQCPVGASLKNGYCSGAVALASFQKFFPAGLLLLFFLLERTDFV